jgi:hypothetical protein
MALIALICPHCGGTVQLDEEMRSGFCVHCGTKIMNDRSVNGSVTIDKNVDIINHLKMAKESAIQHDWATLASLVDNILLMDPDCSDAWYIKALLSMPSFVSPFVTGAYVQGTFDSHILKGENGANKYGIFSKEDISKCWGEYTITVSMKYSEKGVLMRSVGSYGLPITLDGKEQSNVTKDKAGKFGVKGGSHNLEVGMGFTSANETFMVSGDMNVEIEETTIKHLPSLRILIPTQPSSQSSSATAPEEKPAKKGWWGRR